MIYVLKKTSCASSGEGRRREGGAQSKGNSLRAFYSVGGLCSLGSSAVVTIERMRRSTGGVNINDQVISRLSPRHLVKSCPFGKAEVSGAVFLPRKT